MRIVINYKDDIRQVFDASFLVFGEDYFEFESQGLFYSVYRKDILTLHVSEVFPK